MKRLNKIEKNLKQVNNNIPSCGGELGDTFDIRKKPIIIEGYSLYLCECGSCYGVKLEQIEEGDRKELKRLSKLAGKDVTIMSEQNGIWYSTGFLDE